MLAPISRRRLYHEVAERLLEGIRNGEFPPGSKIPSERDLMTVFQVGRPAIREALQTLDRMGVLTISHGERARVSVPSEHEIVERMAESVRFMLACSPSSLEHLKEARLAFEVGIARIAAQKRKPENLAKLQDILDHQKKAVGTQDFMVLDGQFHAAIADISENPIYEALSRGMFGWLSEFHVSQVYSKGNEDVTLAEHAGILEAITSGSSDAAEKAMRDHIARANTLYNGMVTQTP